MESIIPVLAIVGFFGTIVVLIYMFFNSRHKERMALIDSGRSASIFREHESVQNTLKNGLVAIMVGVGLLIGFLLEKIGIPGFVAYLSMVLILGGVGLVLFYLWYGGRETDKDTI